VISRFRPFLGRKEGEEGGEVKGLYVTYWVLPGDQAYHAKILLKCRGGIFIYRDLWVRSNRRVVKNRKEKEFLPRSSGIGDTGRGLKLSGALNWDRGWEMVLSFFILELEQGRGRKAPRGSEDKIEITTKVREKERDYPRDKMGYAN